MPTHRDFPDNSAGKESSCNAGDLGLIPGLGRSPGDGNSDPLQYSGPENSTNCIVHGVAKSRTRLSDFHSLHMPTHILKETKSLDTQGKLEAFCTAIPTGVPSPILRLYR